MQLPTDFFMDSTWREQRIRSGLAFEDACKVSLRYVAERHPDASCAFITGSYSSGNPTASSDVDLFVLNEEAIAPLREALILDRYPLQITVLSTYGLHEWLKESSTFNLMGPLHAMRNAKYIFGSHETFSRLEDVAEQIFNSTDKPLEREIRYFKTSLLCSYIKLPRLCCMLDRTDNLITLIRAAADLVQARAGAKRTGRAQCEQTLQRDLTYNLIVESLPKALLGNTDDISKYTWELLSRDGPPYWSTYPDGPMPLFL
tara:strand:- start:7123 stop:7899 length:777 start_codon:yes stop_codon:yes gene_type:complete